MLTSLGFDTIVVNNREYDNENLCLLLDLFCKCGIKNFIFLSDFDLERNSFRLEHDKIIDFKNRISTVVPYTIHPKVFFNLYVTNGFSSNKDIKRCYSVKKNRFLFAQLPMFTDINFDLIAHDLNNLMYRQKSFPVFSSFDTILNTASDDFCKKLINNKNIGFCFDINYIFDPKNVELFSSVLNSKAFILPMISHNISNYAGILKSAEFFMGIYGNSNYHKLCSLINKCASKFYC